MVQAKRGRILNVGSIAGFVPLPNMSVYAASKAFVLSFSEALSAELRSTGVTITCLCPGATKTGFSRAAHVSGNNPIAQAHVLPTAVAQFGYKAMLAGTSVAIFGLKNKLFVGFAARLLPRAVMRKLMLAYNGQ